MNSNEFFDRLKLIEISRLFVSQYSYREMEVKNIDGIFLENRSARYPLIHISSRKFEDLAQFNENLQMLMKINDEFSRVSNIDDSRMLCIYLDGFVEEKVDNIYSLILKDNNDIINSEILQNDFPLFSQFVNMDQLNDSFSVIQENSRETERDTTNNNERKITDLFAFNQQMKQIKFTRYFTYFFVIVNVLVALFMGHIDVYKYDLSFYNAFFFNFDQYYRIFTGLFLNTSLIVVFVFVYFFMRYNSYVEVKLGTKKTMIVYGLGLLLIMIAMIFQSNGQVLLGSYPLIFLFAGVYGGVTALKSERSFLMTNLLRMAFLILLAGSTIMMQNVSLVIAAIAFVGGVLLVQCVGAKNAQMNKMYFGGIAVIAAFMIFINLVPNQTLKQSFIFENEYIKYQRGINKEKGDSYSKTLDEYYKRLGAINYNE